MNNIKHQDINTIAELKKYIKKAHSVYVHCIYTEHGTCYFKTTKQEIKELLFHHDNNYEIKASMTIHHDNSYCIFIG